MENNNNFENNNPSAENPVFLNGTNTNSINSEGENINQSDIPDEVDIELDPVLTESAHSDYSNENPANSSNYTNTNEPIEPIAPRMPPIEKSAYTPVDNFSSGKGIKIFAIIIALVLLLSACVTGGYYLGINSNTIQTPSVDLAAKPNSEKALTVSQVYEKVSPSVVGIYVYNSEDGIASAATGVIYSKDGYVVTNDHIYADVTAAKFKIYTHDNKMYSADYVAGDTRSDLAVLKISDAKNVTFKAAELGNSNEATVGESVIAIGRSNGANKPSIASEGIISVLSTRVSVTSSYTNSLIQTDSAINPGDSGGALCNVYGQVIGITSAKLVGNEYDGVGYATPTTMVKKVVESLIKYKEVKGRAKLGISYVHIDELTSEITKKPCGLQIGDIDKSSDLYKKSVEINDVITHVNSTKITNPDVILDIIDSAKPGDALKLKIYSVKKKQSLDITVKLLEDTSSSSYSVTKQENNKKEEYNSSEFNFPKGN